MKKRKGYNGKRKPVIDEFGNKWCNCFTPNLISSIGKGIAYCLKCSNHYYH